MPAPLDVDREAVRVLAIAIGVREAARQLNLDENTVLQWSKRGKWFAKPELPILPPTMQKKVVPGVINPAVALQNALMEMSGKTKLGLGKACVKLAGKFADMDADELIQVTPAMKDTASVGQKAFDWSSGASGVQVNVAIGGDHPVVHLGGES